MPAPRHVLLVTDAFPPVAGGSGWSTYELARGLRADGDRVTVLRPRPGTPTGLRVVTDAFDGFDVLEFGGPSPPIPFVRNYLKNERLAERLTPVIRDLVRERSVDIVHGQHLLSIPGAIAGAHAANVPVVATIRDYWPVCYWSDLIHDRSSATLCPACSAGMMTRCVRAHAGAAWPAALPAIPYMRANLRWKADRLADADAVVAVSAVMARDLVARAPALAGRRVEVIPNPVDVATLDRATQDPRPAAVAGIEGPYAIYVGKLAFNKGVQHLVPAAIEAKLPWPLIVVGDGPDRAALEQAAGGAGLDVRFTGWLDRAATLAHLAHAALLVFPSHGPESLSRVLLEASGLGVAIAAMDTGGTRDVVVPGETGLLSTSASGLAADIARLVGDASLRARLGAAARTRVQATFATPAVVTRIGALYDTLIAERRARG
ncbi:MAG: glycosyltransferase family 4 protein [Vicinamibacteraceae bacterium]